MTSRKILLLIFTAFLPFLCSAQKMVKLTNSKSKKELILMEGRRVVYSLHTAPRVKTGVLKKIDADSITVDNERVSLLDVRSLGKKFRGSGILTVLMAAHGGSMIGAAIAPEPEVCSNCQNVVVHDNVGPLQDIILVGGGLTLFILALNIGGKNSPKNVSTGPWKLDVVE